MEGANGCVLTPMGLSSAHVMMALCYNLMASVAEVSYISQYYKGYVSPSGTGQLV